MLMKRILLYITLLSLAIPCDVTIRENFFNENIIGFYLSSIDLESGESTTLLFDYSIDLCVGQDTDLFIDFDIDMFIPSSDFGNKNIDLAEGQARLHSIPPSLEEISFRNTDLNSSTTELSGGTQMYMGENDYQLNISENEMQDIADLFLSQGRAPNGIYTFTFTISSSTGVYPDGVADVEYDSISKTVEIFVPTFLDLITPGTSDISDSTSNVVMMTNPIFQWNSDYCNKCDFFIRVSEYRVNDHSSLEEALDDYSVLPLNDDYFPLSQNINSFQYPNSGVGELYPGKMYVWQIRRSYETSNGPNEEFSPIHLFKVQSLDISDSETSEDANLENLKLLIGSDAYDSFFSEDGTLNGYNKLGPTITINNQSLSINYLLDLINKKNNGQIKIMDIDVQ